MTKSKVAFKTKMEEFIKVMENEGFLLMFSCEGSVTS